MKKELAASWLDVFDKPIEGLSVFNHVSLPHCLGILDALGVEVREATTT